MTEVHEENNVTAIYIKGDGKGSRYQMINNMEWGDVDRLRVTALHQNRTLRIRTTDQNGFIRDYLLSRAGERNIVTMCGYNKINGPIALRYPAFMGFIDEDNGSEIKKLESRGERFEKSAQETVHFLKSIELIHVAAADHTDSGDVQRVFGALKVHRDRTTGLDLEEISLKDAADFYRRMAHNCPSFVH